MFDYITNGFTLILSILVFSYYTASQLDLSEFTYINNYNSCKESQHKQEEINTNLKSKCVDTLKLNTDICEELYDSVVFNRTNIWLDCHIACGMIFGPVIHMKTVIKCVDLFQTYNIVHCISQDEFDKCVKDYETCKYEKFYDAFTFTVTLSFGWISVICMAIYLGVTKAFS